MNRALVRLSLACMVMFLLLLLNINYVQAFETGKLASEPGNVRTFYQQFEFQRGSIVAAGGGQDVTIAESLPDKGSSGMYHRHYPFGPVYAPVTGYASMFGKTGIEGAEDRYLSGTAPGLAVHNLIGLLTGKAKQGAKVFLTISPRAQEAAYHALAAEYSSGTGGHSGAAVAIDPSTGAILAMASYPSFNPNLYATLDGRKLNRIDRRLRHDPSQPLLNRAIEETYPPGSTFKIITASAGFSTGKVANPDTTFPAPQPLRLPNGNFLNNDGGETCGDGHPPLWFAFAMSCNTAYGGLGIKVGGPALRSYADRFGFNNPSLTTPLAVAPSVFPHITDPSLTALSSIGQYDDQITPLQEAMLASTVANGGTLMKPYLVQQVQAPDLSTVSSAHPSVLSHPISPRVAGYLATMMTAVTHNPAGTAYATAGPQATGLDIAGKTGTAETGSSAGLNDAVFTCFAPANNPKIAVGVIIKGGGFGADAAAPIAVQIIKAYLGVS
jgi:peptidoglycan glycosyltransferase